MSVETSIPTVNKSRCYKMCSLLKSMKETGLESVLLLQYHDLHGSVKASKKCIIVYNCFSDKQP